MRMHPASWSRVLCASLALVAAVAVPSAAQKWPSSSPPRALPARDVRFPSFDLRTLPNGLQLVVLRHTEQPAVSLRLIVRAGAAQDPRGKPGVAAMMASLLDQGTTTRKAGDIADTIDSVGGELETGTGRDLSYVNVVVMKDSLELGATLLADVVRNPSFAPEELERQRQQTVSALQVAYQNPDYIANAVFDRTVYGSQPYGDPGNGTPESVKALTRDDLQAFHQRYFAPNNCLLALVGDVTVDEAMAVVTKAFGDWPRREVTMDPLPPAPSPARRVVVIDRPDAVQTEIRVGHLGVPRKTPDYTTLDLAVRVLGGEGANRLHRVLRNERGLTYGASADLQALQRTGHLMAQTNTRSDATGEVLRLISDEFWRLRRERVNEQELSDAKAYLTGNFPLSIETPDQIATQILNVLFYDLKLDELQTYRQRVNAVTVDDVERIAQVYLRPDQLTVVLVGNASAFLDQLKGVGFGKYEVIRLQDLDLTEPTLKRKEAVRNPG